MFRNNFFVRWINLHGCIKMKMCPEWHKAVTDNIPVSRGIGYCLSDDIDIYKEQ